MKKFFLLVAGIALLGVPSTVFDTFTFQAPPTAPNEVQGAEPSRPRSSNANMLFVHWLDIARQSGIRGFEDATRTPVPVNQIVDNFEGVLYNSNLLVVAGTGNLFLTSRSFTTKPTTLSTISLPSNCRFSIRSS